MPHPMTRSAHDEAVEAAVRAGYERMLSTLPEDALRLPLWEAVPTQIKAQFIETLQFQNAAYLRHMRAAGFGTAPANASDVVAWLLLALNAQQLQARTEDRVLFVTARNQRRAVGDIIKDAQDFRATLANAVEVPE